MRKLIHGKKINMSLIFLHGLSWEFLGVPGRSVRFVLRAFSRENVAFDFLVRAVPGAPGSSREIRELTKK